MQNVVEEWLEKTLLVYIQSSHPRALGGNDAEAETKKVEALPSYARSKKSETTQSRHGSINALEEMQFDRQSLASYGLDRTAQEKIYRSFYVHCHGIHELIRTYQGIHPEMSTRMWEVFVAVFQYYDPELRQTFLNYLKENQDQKTVRVIERLTVHVEELTEANEKLKNDNLKLQVARTSAEYQQQMTQSVDQRLIDSLQEKVDFYQNQLHEKEEYVEKLASSLVERKQTCQLSESLLLKLSKQHMTILQEISLLRSVRKDLEKETSILKSKCKTLDKTILQLKDELATTKDELRQETRAHIFLQDQHAKLTEEHDLLKESFARSQADLRETQYMERATHDTLQEVVKLFNATVPELQQFLVASDELESISKSTKTIISKLSNQIQMPPDFRYNVHKTHLPDKMRCMSLQDFIIEPPPPKEKKMKKKDKGKNKVATIVVDGTEVSLENQEESSQEIINVIDTEGNLVSTSEDTKQLNTNNQDTDKERKEDGEINYYGEEEEEEEEEEEQDDGPIPIPEEKDRKKYLHELVENGRVWNRYFCTLQREYFALTQQPILRLIIQILCGKSEELLDCQERVILRVIPGLKTKIEAQQSWQNNVLNTIIEKQRAQSIVDSEAYEKLLGEKQEKERIIETLEAKIVELTEVKEQYTILEPKFLKLIDIYTQSVRDKKEVDGWLQDARDRIAMFEKLEIEWKATRHRLEETETKLEEKEAYIGYLRNEQKKLAGKAGVDRRRTIKRAPGAKESRSTVIEELRRSFSSSSSNLHAASGKLADSLAIAREAAMNVLANDSKDIFVVGGGEPSLPSSPINSPMPVRRSVSRTGAINATGDSPRLSALLRMDSSKMKGFASTRGSIDLSAMSIDEHQEALAYPTDSDGNRIHESEFDDLETVIADCSENLLESLVAISEMVQVSLEMQENSKRIHEKYHGSGNLTVEGAILMTCVERVEKRLQILKDHRDNIFYDISYTLDPSIKKEILIAFDSMMQMPQHMIQLMQYADELFDLRTEKESISSELEKVKLYSARERARIIKQYDDQIYDLKRTVAHLQG